jgi:protein-disulfide isomerase
MMRGERSIVLFILTITGGSMKRVILLFMIVSLPGAAMAQGERKPAAGNERPKSTPQQPASPQPGASQATKPADKKAEDCGCEAKTPPDVLAVVNGVKVMIKDVDDPIKPKIEELQKYVIESRKRELDLQINTRLLEAEAKKRGVSSNTVIEQEVVSKTAVPTDAEARAFYDQNRARITDPFESVKGDIIAYLRDQKQREVAKQLADRLRATAQIKVLIKEVTPPQTEADRARVLATVNGLNITSGDIEDSLQPLIFDVQEQIYALRKQQLDMRINDVLLEQEAQKRKITTTALIETEVKAKAKSVTEEEARKFYDENKNRINGTYEQVKPRLMSYLNDLEQNKLEGEFALQLRKTASIQTYLEEPDPPVLTIATDDQPTKGPATAPVTIVEFTDYQCPSCARTQPVLEEVAREFGDKVRLVSRDFPLDQHTFAFKAAEAAEAAREQGKYWEYVALLFKNQEALEVAKLKEYATQLGLDRKQFDAALDSGKHAERVKRDLAEGRALGVNSTPTVFINGKRVRNKSAESLKAAIEAALKSPAKK